MKKKKSKKKVGANVAAFVLASESRGAIFQWQFEPCGEQIAPDAAPSASRLDPSTHSSLSPFRVLNRSPSSFSEAPEQSNPYILLASYHGRSLRLQFTLQQPFVVLHEL